MRTVYSLAPEQIRVREILNKEFVEIEIWAISNADPNRNGSCFTLASMQKGLDTFVDKPILGYFNREGDFEQHNGVVNHDRELNVDYWDNSKGEQILGFIRATDQREIVEKDGLSWIRCTAIVYTHYNYQQIKRLLKDKYKKVSVEVDILEKTDRNGIEYIDDFNLLGITILGSKGGIPILEGIAGAHLSVLDIIGSERYSQQREALCFAYNQLNSNKGVSTLANMDSKSALTVDKSKEAMSDTDWGEVDKTALRNRVVEASNFKTIAKDVFLDLREGWEEGEVSKLKYPVMQLVDGDKLVYNRGALASAKGYAEKNHEEEVIRKVSAIYEKLGLNSEEDKYDCSVFCDLYDDAEDGSGPDHDEHPEGHPEGDDHPHKGHPHKEPSSDDDDIDDDDKDDDDNKKGEGKMANNQNLSCEDLQLHCDELQMKCDEYEAKCAEYEAQLQAKDAEIEKHAADYEAMKQSYDCANTELESLRAEKQERMKAEQKSFVDTLCAKMNLSADEAKDVYSDCEAGKFASNEEIEKSIAYVCFKKQEKEMEANQARFSTSVSNPDFPNKGEPAQQKSVRDRLRNNLNKN